MTYSDESVRTEIDWINCLHTRGVRADNVYIYGCMTRKGRRLLFRCARCYSGCLHTKRVSADRIQLCDKEGQVTCSDALDVTAAVCILRAWVLAADGCVTRKGRWPQAASRNGWLQYQTSYISKLFSDTWKINSLSQFHCNEKKK